MIVTIVGSQLGDEGKGGMVDVFSENADIIVRFQGGDNAGHTVVEGGEKYKLSLVPSGAVRGKVNVLGNGCVVNPKTLFEEIDSLRDRGLDPDVRVAKRAHVIFPYHRLLDGVEEDAKGDLAAATTGRGIGPTYEDKAARRGIRIGDLVAPNTLRNRLEYVLDRKRRVASEIYGEELPPEFEFDTLYAQYREFGERLNDEGMLVNAGSFLSEAIDDGASVLFEGAQGTALDIDHGIYPYVTSSNASAGGVCTGTGVGPTVVGQGDVVGVVKAYLSRVGTGPLPTELGGVEGQTPSYTATSSGQDEELATYIREEGGEYGTVTGRPRRVGWLDMPMLRHATQVNGLTGLVVNHLDVLAGLEEVKVGHSYDLEEEEILTMPATTERWGDCTTNYRVFDGWPDVDWKTVAQEGYHALPEGARAFLEYIERELGVDVIAIGVGPSRSETIIRDHPFQ